VNPHLFSRPAGMPSDTSDGGEGVNHLRRLKGELVERTLADAVVVGHGRAPEAAIAGVRERRESPRLRCSGSVEFRADGSDVRMWATLTDVSVHGCYVEMNTTFPAGTKVDLVLKSFGIRIQVRGTVRAAYPSLGMGIRFGEIDPEQQLQLEKLLAALSGHKAGYTGGSSAKQGPAENVSNVGNVSKDTLGTIDQRAFLHEITEFFQKNLMLSREEFHDITKRVRRS
jgi:hypothetical protein